jgi:hypothetical protein
MYTTKILRCCHPVNAEAGSSAHDYRPAQEDVLRSRRKTCTTVRAQWGSRFAVIFYEPYEALYV